MNLQTFHTIKITITLDWENNTEPAFSACKQFMSEKILKSGCAFYEPIGIMKRQFQVSRRTSRFLNSFFIPIVVIMNTKLCTNKSLQQICTATTTTKIYCSNIGRLFSYHMLKKHTSTKDIKQFSNNVLLNDPISDSLYKNHQVTVR